MPTVIKKPHAIEVEGELPMLIQEYVGRVNTDTKPVSIARVLSTAGRVEKGKTLEFDEYAVVQMGTLRIESRDGIVDVRTGETAIVRKGKWVRYSTPEETEYIAICLPAFAPGLVQWDRD